jgi:hypothetical protein
MGQPPWVDWCILEGTRLFRQPPGGDELSARHSLMVAPPRPFASGRRRKTPHLPHATWPGKSASMTLVSPSPLIRLGRPWRHCEDALIRL